MALLLLALAAGSIGGFLDSMAGSGFGAMATTSLAAGGISASTAVVSVNIAKIASGLSGSLAHVRLGNVRARIVAPLAVGGVTGALIGGSVASSLSDIALRTVMHTALLGAAGLIAYLYSRRRPESMVAPVEGGALQLEKPLERGMFGRQVIRHRRAVILVAIGAVAGLANTLAGAFGPVVLAGLLLAKGGAPRLIVGSVTVAEVIVAAAGILSLTSLSGNAKVSLEIAAPLAIGGMVAAPFGALMAKRVSPRKAALLIAALLAAFNAFALLGLVGG